MSGSRPGAPGTSGASILHMSLKQVDVAQHENATVGLRIHVHVDMHLLPHPVAVQLPMHPTSIDTGTNTRTDRIVQALPSSMPLASPTSSSCPALVPARALF